MGVSLHPAMAAEPLAGAGSEILVVDDSAAARAELRRRLESAPLHARVREAADGVEALRAILESRPDCVLCDLNMPGMDGVTFLRALRAQFTRVELPVLILTGRDSTTDRITGFRCGANDFVSKPFLPEELVLRVDAHASLARMNRQLTLLAQTDPLTGLANRRTLDEKLAQELTRFQRTGTPLSMVVLDIDHFKRINDTHGHPVGDAVISALARIIAGKHRPYDVAARTGGEEFAVLLPGASASDALLVAERLRAAVQQDALGPLPRGAVTVSVGVASALADDAADPNAFASRADAMLYQAKHQGRNRVCVWAPTLAA